MTSASSASSSGAQARRISNRAKVTAVADQRTESIVVVASRDLMPQVENVVMQLDADPKGKQTLAVYQVKNASPTAVANVLQDAFQRNTASSTRNASTQTDALQNRANTQSQQQNQTSGQNTFSQGRTGSGVGGAGGGFGQ